MADELIAKAEIKNYNLMCLIGEMKQDHTWFQKAWDDSKGKCAKAMRNLGRYYFFENKFQESADCFAKCLAINKLYPDIWFTQGCAYMRLEDFKKAIFSFGNVVSIDERKTEAWANIANCYVVQKKYFQAVVCCEQALKNNGKSWKIWNNYILYSLQTMQFYKAIKGVRTLLRYSQLESVNGQLLLRIVECFNKKFIKNEVHEDDPDKNKAVPCDEHDFGRHKAQLYRFFDDCTEKINDFKFWRLICKVKKSLGEDRELVKELKFKEIRSIMKINWNVEIAVCEQLERTLNELITVIFSESPATDEERQFVKVTAQAITDTLKRPCELEKY